MSFLLPTLLIATTGLPSSEVHFEPTLLSLFSLTQPTDTKDNIDVPAEWGKEGTWRWGIHGGYAEDLKKDENEFALLGVEFDYFIADNLSLDIGLNLVDFNQIGQNTDGLNTTLQLRWHTVTKEDWSFFLEGGAGVLFTQDDVPSGSSDFNFTPQVGLGFSFDKGNQTRCLVGVRWHHISNANTHRTNPGRDSIMFWIGITLPF